MLNIDALILCGGQGSRLREVVSDRPKPMAEINGTPFLDILLNYLKIYGFKRFVLCVGHMADYIENYYNGRGDVLISREGSPLGTGGAVRNAETLIHSSPFLVMNGDSFCPLDLNKFIEFHRQKKALASLALAESDDIKDYGKIILNDSGRIMRFSEKSEGTGRSFINAGIYLFEKEVFSMIPPDSECSLEYDIFPKLEGKAFYGFFTNEMLMDIGTPERYQYAKSFLDLRPRSVN